MSDSNKSKKSDKKPFSAKPQVRRMSSEEASSFKEKKRLQAESAWSDTANEPPRRSRERKPLEPLKANVHLNLSPRLLALAEEFAEEAGVTVSKYLVDILRFAIYSKADTQPQHDRYRSEFVSKNKRKLTSWSPESEEQETQDRSESYRDRQDTRENRGSSEKRESSGAFEKRKRDGKFRGKGRPQNSKQNRSGSQGGGFRGRSSNDKKRGGSSGSSSRKPSHGRGNAGKRRGR